MTIRVYEENGTTIVAPEGKIDHLTAEEFESEVTKQCEAHDSLIIEMKDVKYVSSAALRAILNINDMMEGKGQLVFRNVNKNVMDILNITRFSDYLDIR